IRALVCPPGECATAIFLAGDSSLDNKAWLFNQGALAERWRPGAAHAPARNGYEFLLSPPRMVCDVTYWMNQILWDLGADCCVVPSCGGLYEQELLLRDRIRPSDMLVISIGGNDIALAPSVFTAIAIVLLMLSPWFTLCTLNPAVAYFVFMFRFQVQCYAHELTAKTTPSKIAVCMIYHLDERNGNSWANPALCALCYCCFPGLLQRRLRVVFELGTSRVRVPGSEVVPIFLGDALDGRCTEDYCQRVEPSVIGGQKIARLILHRLGWPCKTPGYHYGKPPDEA
ncbi:unnamed protein product, partial [Prorocentrum cordatum]